MKKKSEEEISEPTISEQIFNIIYIQWWIFNVLYNCITLI